MREAIVYFGDSFAARLNNVQTAGPFLPGVSQAVGACEENTPLRFNIVDTIMIS